MMIPMIFATIYDVTLRYFFKSSTHWAYDLTWMIYSAFFILGGAYTLVENGHINIDVLLNMLPARTQYFLTALYLLIFLIPFALIVIIYSIPWAWHATVTLECAEHTLWRPYVFPIKWMVPVGFFFLLLQGISSMTRNFIYACKGDGHGA
jgi:TRAP-type mannitol/chloroaromatic compound transport system permease small subunit